MLQKANDLQQAQIRILAGVAILFLILGFVIFYLYRQKSKAYRQIVRKNLEIVKAEKQMEVRRSMVAPDGQSMDFLPADEIENTTLGLMVKFSRLMKEEKPYLEARLTVDDICRKISTNRSYLSQMIREHYNQNFNGHLNELRIKEARRLLAEPENDHISIEGIGSMSGFSNKVTFHTTFRKQIGVTPAYFRKSMIRS
jgi:YesN/AraC family two-component response regulator